MIMLTAVLMLAVMVAVAFYLDSDIEHDDSIHDSRLRGIDR